MTNQTASLEYRRAATQQASVVGLVIALLDTLAGDLRRAASAMDKADIQGRSDQLVHAIKVIQQLEFMLDMNKGGATAEKVNRFYAHVRRQIMQAQFKKSSMILRKLVDAVLEVREAWQQLDRSASENKGTEPAQPANAPSAEYTAPSEPRLSFSCSF